MKQHIRQLNKFFTNQTKRTQYITTAMVVVLVAGIGTYLLIGSHAATPYASITADSGSLSGSATKQACSDASDGSCVMFGNSTSSCALSSFSSTNQPSCYQFFDASSPLNTSLPSSPTLASYSSAVINHMTSAGWYFGGGSTSNFQLTASSQSRPLYFAHPTDPLVKLTSCSGACWDQNRNSIVGTSFHVPQNAAPGSQGSGGNQGDDHFDVIETDTGDEYDFWQASIDWSNDTMTANNGDLDNVETGSGVQLKVGADAAGISLLGGLMRPSELLDATNANSYIHHALVLDVDCTADGSDTSDNIPQAVYPSNSRGPDGSCSNQGTAPPYGALLMLNMTDAQIAASGAPAWEQTIMKTLEHYGAYVSDSQDETSISIFRQSCGSWESLGAPDMQQSVFQQLGSSDGTYYNLSNCANYATENYNPNYGLTSSVPIPVNKLEVVNPCVIQKQC